MNVYCVRCNHRCMADEGVYHEGPYLCPIDGGAMRANPDEIPPPPEGFSQFDHTFTPDQAVLILDEIPDDSHHWRDIPRKAPNAVAKYTTLMLLGEWRDETLEHGFYEHPVRFDEQGRITHGVMRLMACMASGREFRAAVFCPTGFLPEVFSWN